MFNIILNYFHCFFTSTIEIAPVQTILYQFKLFCPSSKTNCSKVKIELQHIHLPFSFRSLDLFVASLLFRKGTSFCVMRRKQTAGLKHRSQVRSGCRSGQVAGKVTGQVNRKNIFLPRKLTIFNSKLTRYKKESVIMRDIVYFKLQDVALRD